MVDTKTAFNPGEKSPPQDGDTVTLNEFHDKAAASEEMQVAIDKVILEALDPNGEIKDVHRTEPIKPVAKVDLDAVGKIDVEKCIDSLKAGMIAKEKAMKVGTTFLMPETVELEVAEGRPANAHADLPKSKLAKHIKYPEPRMKHLVLNITTSFGKRYTCRTVEELETYIENVKVEKKLKRDEDVDIQLGFGRMTEAEYGQVPACKYFIKLK